MLAAAGALARQQCVGVPCGVAAVAYIGGAPVQVMRLNSAVLPSASQALSL